MTIPIAISTVKGKCLNVCLYSLKEYAHNHPVYLQGQHHFYKVEERDFYRYRSPTNFGDDYNSLMDWVFIQEQCDAVIISNDDVVITPYTLRMMREDLDFLKKEGYNVGLLTARTDQARPPQNIKYIGFSSGNIRPSKVVSPIFCYVSREAFDAAKLPPINWFGDDVWCLDLVEKGFQHFVSRAYVHHVGSQTIGHDGKALAEASRVWVQTHRPQYMKHCFGQEDEEE